MENDSATDLHAVLNRSKDLGLLGPGDISVHIDNARAFVSHIETNAHVMDIGSGGGVPGLVIASMRPDLTMVLLDAGERRIAFLRDAIRVMAIGDRVRTELGRAETLAWRTDLRGQFDAVVARSFAQPSVTAECSTGFLKVGGHLLVSEPSDLRDRWPADGLATLGFVASDVHAGTDTSIRELLRIDADITAYPRRVGVPSRRPLFDHR